MRRERPPDKGFGGVVYVEKLRTSVDIRDSICSAGILPAKLAGVTPTRQPPGRRRYFLL